MNYPVNFTLGELTLTGEALTWYANSRRKLGDPERAIAAEDLFGRVCDAMRMHDGRDRNAA
jgi:hypothetical protein